MLSCMMLSADEGCKLGGWDRRRSLIECTYEERRSLYDENSVRPVELRICFPLERKITVKKTNATAAAIAGAIKGGGQSKQDKSTFNVSFKSIKISVFDA